MRARLWSKAGVCACCQLVMAKYDCCCSQKRTADKECEISHKQWQQHQGETAKHRYPVLHPLAVGEDNEAEGAEHHAADAIRREES